MLAKTKKEKYQNEDLPHYKFHRKHKILFGGFSSLVIVFIILSSVALYTIYIKLDANYDSLQIKIEEMQQNTNNKLDEVTNNLILTQSEVDLAIQRLSSTEERISSLGTEFDELKASASADFSGVIEKAVPAVVTIRTNVAQGTGFIIDDRGYIVTNAHVLEGASQVNAITYDKQNIQAEFIGYDAEYDVALLKISGSYSELELANSNDIQTGEKVIAIGNPLGLQFSVSEGIVSAVHREFNGMDAYIQTDAALNPGNSGGPLINKQGEVIGINNFKVSGGESLGFALESNYLRDVVNEISKKELEITLI